MTAIEIAAKAPDFALRDQAGKMHTLKDYAGHVVVLYFYPKDDTSGCTAEACQFRDHLPDFRKIKAVVLGVSPDDEASHQRFAGKHALTFTLLADVPGPDGTPQACAAYGVWEQKSMYGRQYMGVVRTTFLIDGEGKVVRRWDHVKVPGHVGEVLAAVKVLHSGGTLTDVDGVLRHPERAGQTKGRSRSSDSDPPYQPIHGARGGRGANLDPKSAGSPRRKPT
jgi:peroxiredoxin Q/BCP